MENMEDAVKAFVTDPVLQQRLAKYLVQQCFRNSVLENLHAGKAPESIAGDYSDVVVLTPAGEIPWRQVSRFDDQEMKTLMIDCRQPNLQIHSRPFRRRDWRRPSPSIG